MNTYHYDTLDILPLKLYYKICETSNLSLLSNQIEGKDLENLWKELDSSFKDLDKSEESRSAFRLNKTIAELENKLKLILMSVEALKFDDDQRILDLLKSFNNNVRTDNTENYYSDLERIERETNGIVVNISRLKKQLPKPSSDKVNIDEVLASYSAILGIDFDYNSISCSKFFALKKQVFIKIDNYKRNLPTQNK